MSYQALYRVWRPQTFGDIVGQEAVAHTLQNAVKTGKMSHAYLFTGPRGTGKTSAAKIVSKAINCPNQVDGEPCNQCEICKAINAGSLSDVIEIDAASNNGVDEMRDIRENVRYAPTEAAYKVYIIDEVHMLSTGAFNALLKTLEEPPANVLFILATTEIHKIPATIISRTQRFDFKRISHQDIENRMAYILAQDNIQYEDGALAVIARAANGGMRDALSLLDQVISFSEGTITLETSRQVTGVLSEEELIHYTKALSDGDVTVALADLHKLLDSGQEAARFVEEQLIFVRDLLIAKEIGGGTDAVESLTQRYDTSFYALAKEIDVALLYQMMDVFKETQAEIRYTVQASIYLEVATVQLCQKGGASKAGRLSVDAGANNQAVPVAHELPTHISQVIADLQEQVASLSSQLQNGQGQAAKPTPANRPVKRSNTTGFTPNLTKVFQVLNQATKKDLNDVSSLWEELIASLPGMQAAMLKATFPAAASPTAFVVRFDYEVLCKKVDDDEETRRQIEQMLSNRLGHPTKMYYLTSDQWQEARQTYVKAMKNGGLSDLVGDDAATVADKGSASDAEAFSQDSDAINEAMAVDGLEDEEARIRQDQVDQAVSLFGKENVTIVDD
ncbi:DNA polymerase III subunit gamma/tau [Aerococcus sp. 1KP-2016]|uniref:DNA polymerase III subunit gamma/tau n=1 Tax=Aerococcus sp. 1KP-2016 TaxID=1981982 RepID=UPI000B98D838|nr:DNA polymerase III subunit gamma/tau [Aerococcus sp. 1KP-2016]OYQ67694.1 DNA polymerase III subunit gamma/tau [Aerococcus sp. 1KP-2016]